MHSVHSLCGPAIPTGLNGGLAFLSVDKKGRYDYLNSSRGTSSLSVFFSPTYCRSASFCETFSSFVMPSQSSLSINCTSFFSLFILSLYTFCSSLITRLFTLPSSILCLWYVWKREPETERAWGMAELDYCDGGEGWSFPGHYWQGLSGATLSHCLTILVSDWPPSRPL